LVNLVGDLCVILPVRFLLLRLMGLRDPIQLPLRMNRDCFVKKTAQPDSPRTGIIACKKTIRKESDREFVGIVRDSDFSTWEPPEPVFLAWI